MVDRQAGDRSDRTAERVKQVPPGVVGSTDASAVDLPSGRSSRLRVSKTITEEASMNNNGAYFRKLAMGRREFVRRSTLTALTLSAVPSLAMKEGIAASKEV